jgi:hypothetical protein
METMMALGIRIPALLLACSAGLSLAHADTATPEAEFAPENRMSAAVTAAMAKHVGNLVDPETTIGLFLVGYQRVVADSYAGFEVDEEKARTVMDALLADVTGLVEEGENNLVLDVVMVGYGMGVGGETAVAAYDQELYCANTAEFRESSSKESNDRFGSWKTAE